MGAIYSPVKSVDFQRIRQCDVPKERAFWLFAFDNFVVVFQNIFRKPLIFHLILFLNNRFKYNFHVKSDFNNTESVLNFH
jgi:hypothetical protein